LDVSAGLAKEPKEVWRRNLVGTSLKTSSIRIFGCFLRCKSRLSSLPKSQFFFLSFSGTGHNSVVIIFALPYYLYCGSHSYIYKLQCETGEVIWKAAHRSATTSLWLHQNKLLVGSGGYVECLDVETGSSKWTANLKGAGYSLTTMIVIGKEVVAGCAGYLFSFDIDTGNLVWSDPLKVRHALLFEISFQSVVNNQPRLFRVEVGVLSRSLRLTSRMGSVFSSLLPTVTLLYLIGRQRKRLHPMGLAPFGRPQLSHLCPTRGMCGSPTPRFTN
jgi:hypothetical protein